MSFRLIHANYDKKTRRAYVELRQDDVHGDEMIVAAIFSNRRTSIITKKALEYDLATKARYLMKRAAVGLDSPRMIRIREIPFNDPANGLRWTAWPRCFCSGLFLSACA